MLAPALAPTSPHNRLPHGVALRAGLLGARQPLLGLQPLGLQLTCEPDWLGREVRLALTFAQERFSAPVTLSGTTTRPPWVLNTHRLPDGPQPAHVCLSHGGQTLLEGHGRLVLDNRGALGATVRDSLARNDLPLILQDGVDASLFDYADPALTPWFDRPDAHAQLERWQATGELGEADFECLRQIVDGGYTVLPDRLDESLVEACAQAIDRAAEEGHGGYTEGSSQRMEHLHRRFPALRKVWLHAPVLRFLTRLFRSLPAPCQTLCFRHGSQQALHQDTVHLTPFPAGYMAGVWVALEDAHPEAGPLHVVPGSHRLPRVYRHAVGVEPMDPARWDCERFAPVTERWQAMAAAAGLDEQPYLPKAGTILVWHENLLHGGSPRLDPSRTRKSIVSHYFAQGAIGFYDSTASPGCMLGLRT